MAGLLEFLKSDRFATVLSVLLIGGIMSLLVLPRIPTWTRAMTLSRISRVQSTGRALEQRRQDTGTYPTPGAPLPDHQLKGNGIPGQTTLDIPGFEKDAHDPFPHAPGPIRYATGGDRFVLAATGPDGRWNFDLRTWKSEMKKDDPALSAFSYDPTNGMYSSGDVIRLGGVEPFK